MQNIRHYLVKVVIDGKEDELKSFGESEMEILDNMVEIPAVDEVLEIEDLETGKKWMGGGSLEKLREIKSEINKFFSTSKKEVH